MKKKNEITWAHISDIHFGHTNYVEDVMRKDLPNYLRTLNKQYDFEAVFVRGVLVYSRKFKGRMFKKDDVEKIHKIIKDIQNAMNVDNNHTCIAIGNHDIIRSSKKNKIIKTILASGYRSQNETLSREIEQISKTEERFKSLYETILGRNYKSGHSLYNVKVPIDGKNQEIDVLNIDTTLSAEAKDGNHYLLQDGNLLIGLTLLKNELYKHASAVPIIAIGHHPLSAISKEDQTFMIQELRRAGVCLYLCGHTHKANIELFGNENSEEKKIVQVCCGANMERLKNGNDADKIFLVRSYELSNNSIRIETHEYIRDSHRVNGWKVSSVAPFAQYRLENKLNLSTFYYPIRNSPFHFVIKKYIDSIMSFINEKIYVNLTVVENKKQVINVDRDKAIRNIYVADAGYGKTTLLRIIARQCLGVTIEDDPEENAIHEKILQDECKCPFYIDLKMDKVQKLLSNIDFLLSEIIGLNLHNGLFFRWIDYISNQNKLVLLIDGFEHLASKQREEFLSGLSLFYKEKGCVELHITCKDFVFDSVDMIKKYSDFAFFEIKPLNDDQIKLFCQKWYENKVNCESINKVGDLELEISKFTTQILSNPEIRDLAQVPRMLDIILQNSQRDHILPRNRVQLYQSFTKSLLHDVGDNPEMDMRVLTAIAFKMSIDKSYTITVKDFTSTTEDVFEKCDWFYSNSGEIATDFFCRICNNSGLFNYRSNSEKISFKNSSLQDYFASVAITKGWYIGLDEKLQEECEEGKINSILISAIDPFLIDVNYGNLLEFVVLQLNSYQTYIVINTIIEKIILWI